MLKKIKLFPIADQTIASIMILVCSFFVVSCHSDEDNHDPVPYQVLDTILSVDDINFTEAVQSLVDESGVTEEQIRPYKQKLDLASMRTRKYKAYTIKYHTTDPNGVPVVASGVVYYPKTGSPKGVIEAVPFNKNKYDCASKKLANLEMMQGLSGYIVLVPDLIGCGATEAMPVPYLYHDNVAKVCADMRLAATELVWNIYGRKMPSWTMVSGISLAASEAWALARYYHFHPEMGVHVNQVWVSGGAYNPLMVLEQQLRTQHTDYAFIPNALYSVNYYDGLGFNLKDAFRGELKDHYEEWCTGYVRLFDLSDKLGSDISQYLNIDFFSDNNPDFVKLKQSVAKFTIPNDWVPTCSIHIYHGRDDTFVPVESAEELVEYLRSVGAKVDYVVTETGHIDNCIAMGVDLVEVLYK